MLGFAAPTTGIESSNSFMKLITLVPTAVPPPKPEVVDDTI